MITIIGTLSVALAIIFIEYPSLKKGTFKKDKYLFVIFLFIGVGLNIINGLRIKFPNLLDWLIIIYKPISQLVFS